MSEDAIPGTVIFDGAAARAGYALNKMCYSFNAADARASFKADEEGYMTRFGLNDRQKAAICNKHGLLTDPIALLDAKNNRMVFACPECVNDPKLQARWEAEK